MAPEQSHDAQLLRDAGDHARKLAVALAADAENFAQPWPALAPEQLTEGRAALSELLATVSHLADSLDRTTQP